MRIAAAIRTNKWGEDEARTWSALAPVFGDDLSVVFHDYAGQEMPCAPVEISNGWLAANGLAEVPDWGWRCGDYAYYALRQAMPDYDAYWLIEPDVFFTGDPAEFFARFAGERADALGYQLGPFDAGHPFAQALDIPPMRAIFALTRVSGRALDRLFVERQKFGQLGVRARKFTNDELFVFSHVAADPELRTESLEVHAPDWFEGAQFDTNPDLLLDEVQARYAGVTRVLHPVRARSSFKAAVASRLAANTGFLRKMSGALASLDDSELDEIAGLAATRLRTSLEDNKAR